MTLNELKKVALANSLNLSDCVGYFKDNSIELVTITAESFVELIPAIRSHVQQNPKVTLGNEPKQLSGSGAIEQRPTGLAAPTIDNEAMYPGREQTKQEALKSFQQQQAAALIQGSIEHNQLLQMAIAEQMKNPATQKDVIDSKRGVSDWMGYLYGTGSPQDVQNWTGIYPNQLPPYAN